MTTAPTAKLHTLSDHDAKREAHALDAFTKRGSAPRATFALVLVSVAVAALSLSVDEVERYSSTAFLVGVGLAMFLSLAVGFAIESVTDARWKTVVTLLFPTMCGASIGVIVQSIVLLKVGSDWGAAVKDLGGLIDTTNPISWVLGGVVLGGMPALAVTAFLLLAARALKRVVGHDASESFGVAFIGLSGLISALGLFVVHGLAVAPLFLVTIASALTVLVAILIDGSRIAFLRRVYARSGEDFDIVPAERFANFANFANDAGLAPIVAAASTGSVLVKVSRGEYRAAAVTPIALVANTEEATIRPLRRRRATGAMLLVATSLLACLAAAFHSV